MECCGNTEEGQLTQSWGSCSKEPMLELILRKGEMTLPGTELKAECSRQGEQHEEGPKELENKVLRDHGLSKDSV